MNRFTFKAKCSRCKSEFARPELGDFSYGDTIFTSVSGDTYTYFYAINHPVTDIVEKSLPSKASFFAVCAQISDPINGQTFVTGHVCPFCNSREMEYWQGARVGSIELNDASFTEFLSLTEIEQCQRVLKAAQS